MVSIKRFGARLRRWKHRNLKSYYGFNPKKGTERYLYKCPFCGRMAYENAFTSLEIPKIESRIMLFGGYRGIKVLKATMSSEMQERIIDAMKEKIEWLYEKLGGENLWLKSRSALMIHVPNLSSWKTVDSLSNLRKSVTSKVLVKTSKTSSLD